VDNDAPNPPAEQPAATEVGGDATSIRDVDAVVATTPRVTPSPRTPPVAWIAFFDKLTRRAEHLLPVPFIQKRRSKSSQAAGETPRRNRRLAGATVAFQLGELETRARKKVMRALDIIGENEGINQQAQDEYAKLFGHRPSTKHIQAMTALFKLVLAGGPGAWC
jgi:hypothetical protein